MSGLDQAHHAQNQCQGDASVSEEEIGIPKYSFTAFRLTFAPVRDVSYLAATAFLGKVPDAWTALSRRSFLSSITASSTSQVRNSIRQIASRAKNNLRLNSRMAYQADLNAAARDALDEVSTAMVSQNSEYESSDNTQMAMYSPTEGNHEQALSDSQSECNSITSDFLNGFMGKKPSLKDLEYCDYSRPLALSRRSSMSDNPPVLDPYAPAIEDSFDGEPLYSGIRDANLNGGNHKKSYLGENLVKEKKSSHTNSGIYERPENSFNGHEYANDLSAVNLSEPVNTTTQGDNLGSVESLVSREPTLNENYVQKENTNTRTAAKKPKVHFTNPDPENDHINELLQREYVSAEREHNRAIKKFRAFAAKSKGKAQTGGSKLKLKVVENLIKKHRPGDTIRADKMLVMVKRSNKFNDLSPFTESSDFDTYVEDHWREYNVVLKKTADSRNPLQIQLFEVERRTSHKDKSFKGKPTHSFIITDRLRANFYSHSDKTISIVQTLEEGVRIFLMNTKFVSVAYKWLYLMKEIMGSYFYSLMKIKLAGSNTQISIQIPPHLLQSVGLETLRVNQLPCGYRVQNDVLISFIKAKLDSSIMAAAQCDTTVKEWMSLNPDPWFCFRFYDRIEWIPPNGKVLFVQSHLLLDVAVLEYRQVSRVPLSLKDGNGTMVYRPLPVEGFLSRITNTIGKEYSHLRAFYKIQYFFTAEGILFFSPFFKGIPPSEHNQLLKDDVDRFKECQAIPSIYLKNPYNVDENEHISWLNSDEFAKFDNEAVEEFSRKVQLIIGAHAMIDLCSVSSVEPIPLQKIQAHHRYFQSYLWHSSPTTIDDEEIMDCGFEIKLNYGSHLKVLTSSKAMRDEWVKRLSELVSYWKTYRTQVINSMMTAKAENQTLHHLDDYTDSNLKFGPNAFETQNATANSMIFNNTSMAMSTGVLLSGYLYQKQKKHSSFSQYYVVLCPGYIVTYSLFKRSKLSGVWKQSPSFERYMSIPLSECYLYAEGSSSLDLVTKENVNCAGESDLPRLYPDGWKSSEEESMRSFSIWFRGKRALRNGAGSKNQGGPENPSLIHMARKSGLTGKILVFLAKSRQERELWVYNVLQEINRFANE